MTVTLTPSLDENISKQIDVANMLLSDSTNDVREVIVKTNEGVEIYETSSHTRPSTKVYF